MSPSPTATLAGLTVGRVGLGTMSLTGRGAWGDPPDPAAAVALLRRAADLGVRLFDTADSYGPETVERLLRKALHPYDGLAIATKGGFLRSGPHAWRADCRPESLRRACEGSLERLGVERIDLYQLHVVDAQVPLEDSLGTLVALRREGKIAHIGVSNVTPAELERALETTELAAVQNRFSLVETGSEPVVHRCEREGIPFIAWAPLAKGFLAEPSAALLEVAQRHGATPSQVALAWVVRRPLALAIPGTSSVEHLEENLGAATVDLDDEDCRRLERAAFARYRARRLARRARIHAGRAKRAVRR